MVDDSEDSGEEKESIVGSGLINQKNTTINNVNSKVGYVQPVLEAALYTAKFLVDPALDEEKVDEASDILEQFKNAKGTVAENLNADNKDKTR